MNRTEDFRFTEILWHELGRRPIKMGKFIENAVNKSLKIKDYGDIFDYLFFAFIINLPIQIVHEEKKRVSRKQRKILIYAKVDYEKFIKSDDRAAFMMLCDTFLIKLKEMTKRKDKDFDWKRLYADVENIVKNLEMEELALYE